MKIDQTIYAQEFEDPTRSVGPQREPCYYLKALFNTLVQYRPKNCIEIGTHTGNTTKVFQKYFDEYQKDGMLVTCDIKKYVDLSYMKNVKQLIVAHHSPDVDKLHRVNMQSLSYDYKNSVQTNIALIKNFATSFDFAFIDGDHTADSFFKDIEICENLLSAPKIMLLDDTKEPFHECSKSYYEIIKQNKKYTTYDYDDWSKFAGCSLVKVESN